MIDMAETNGLKHDPRASDVIRVEGRRGTYHVGRNWRHGGVMVMNKHGAVLNQSAGPYCLLDGRAKGADYETQLRTYVRLYEEQRDIWDAANRKPAEPGE